MAQIPTSGNIEMFNGANSIHEVLKAELGMPDTDNFDAILTFVRQNCTLQQFNATYGPVDVQSVNSTEHFRGFPASKFIRLSNEGNSAQEACQNAGPLFWQGGYTGTLSVNDTLGVPINGNVGYFKILDASDAHLIGDVVVVDDDQFVAAIIDSPCITVSGIYHYCENAQPLLF